MSLSGTKHLNITHQRHSGWSTLKTPYPGMDSVRTRVCTHLECTHKRTCAHPGTGIQSCVHARSLMCMCACTPMRRGSVRRRQSHAMSTHMSKHLPARQPQMSTHTCLHTSVCIEIHAEGVTFVGGTVTPFGNHHDVEIAGHVWYVDKRRADVHGLRICAHAQAVRRQAHANWSMVCAWACISACMRTFGNCYDVCRDQKPRLWMDTC